MNEILASYFKTSTMRLHISGIIVILSDEICPLCHCLFLPEVEKNKQQFHVLRKYVHLCDVITVSPRPLSQHSHSFGGKFKHRILSESCLGMAHCHMT